MIHLFKTCMITAFILGLTWSAPLRAQDQRYISIRNTDTIWLPGNICAYQFRLDNGGNDEGFGPLTITLQLKDKYGQTLVTRKMETCHNAWQRLFIYQEKTDMLGYTEYVLAEGSFSYGQAVAVITAYRNVFIQDDPGMHFRRVIRNAEGQRRWRCRNSEADAGKQLNAWLASGGLLRQ